MGLLSAADAFPTEPLDLEIERPVAAGLPLWIRLFRLSLWVLLPLGLIAGLVLLAGHVRRLPLKVFRGHEGVVMALAFTPDGRLLASGGQDGRIKFWDPHTGEERGTLEAHERRVSAVAFSPDGRLLASGSFDRTVKLWDARSPRHECTRALTPEYGQVQAVVFSPNGRLLAAALDGSLPDQPVTSGRPTSASAGSAYDNASEIHVWDIASGERVARLVGEAGWFKTLAFSPDGSLLAAGALEPVWRVAPQEVRLYDTTTWRLQRRLMERAGIEAVAFSPGGQTLAVAGWSRVVSLYDLPTQKPKGTLPPQRRWITSIAFSPDGRLLASGSSDFSVRVWDLETNRGVSRTRSHQGWVTAVAFAPDGQRLATAGQDGAVKLWAVGPAVAPPVAQFDPAAWLQDPMVWAWVGFHVFIILMLAIDLGLFQRKAHAPSLKEAGGWYVLWVIFAILFGAGVWFFKGNQRGQEFAAGYLIEQSLSVDNLFVFLVVFRYFAVPAHLQHRVLFWGIIGALVMRAAFILVGAELLIHFPWTLYVFGVFLIYTGYKLMRAGDHQVHPERNILLRIARKVFRFVTSYESNRFFVRHAGKLHATPLFLVLLVIESTDVFFAVDSIPAILGVFEDPRQPDIFIAYTSNIFAILGLRSLFFLLAGFLGMFRFLNVGLSFVLIFVGVKMVLAAADLFKMDSMWSLAIIASLLGASIVASILAGPKRPPATPVPPPSSGGPDGEIASAPPAVEASPELPEQR